jgi:hypothetical protein
VASLTQSEVADIQTALASLKSKRARIMVALKSLLATITKDRNYTQNVMSVGFDVKGWRDKTEEQTPAVYIIDSNYRITKHAGCIREYEWTIPVFGVVKGIDIVAFEEFLADLEEAIYDNNTLFGQVNKMEIDQTLTDNQLFSELNDSGAHLFELTLNVEFTRRARDPR